MFWVGSGTSSVLVYELLRLINNSTCMGVDFLNKKKKKHGGCLIMWTERSAWLMASFETGWGPWRMCDPVNVRVRGITLHNGCTFTVSFVCCQSPNWETALSAYVSICHAKSIVHPYPSEKHTQALLIFFFFFVVDLVKSKSLNFLSKQGIYILITQI